jgi:hypothetical protein
VDRRRNASALRLSLVWEHLCQGSSRTVFSFLVGPI